MATLILRNLRTFRRVSPLKSERGAEIVEMVLVLPLLLFIFVGIVDFSLMLQRFAVLTNAAVEGARVGSLPGYKIPEDVQARVRAYAQGGGIQLSNGEVDAVTVSVPAAGGGSWPAVEVTVTHNYTLRYVGGMATFFGGTAITVPLRARSTMRSQVGAGS